MGTDLWESSEPLAFRVPEIPCPECGNHRVIGWLYLNETGEHQHTHYVCTWWPSGGKRCGWHGWSTRIADEPRTLRSVWLDAANHALNDETKRGWVFNRLRDDHGR